MRTYILKVIHPEFKTVQGETTIKANSRNEALKVARELKHTYFYHIGFFDRYLHAGLITYTNHYGWFCQ